MKDFSDKKILIFSDTHLKCKFDEKWFFEIKPIIKSADMVIINGDFWEDISCEFENFIQSKWEKKLFPLLKNKTIFVHGNNDELSFVKNKNDLRIFSLENYYNFTFKYNDKIFHLEHGHLRLNKKYWWREAIIIIKRNFKIFYSFIKQYEEKIDFLFRNIDKEYLKKFKTFSKKNKEINIFGHIHTPKHNLDDDFIVLGAFKNGNKRYIFIENGEIEFVDEKY